VLLRKREGEVVSRDGGAELLPLPPLGHVERSDGPAEELGHLKSVFIKRFERHDDLVPLQHLLGRLQVRPVDLASREPVDVVASEHAHKVVIEGGGGKFAVKRVVEIGGARLHHAHHLRGIHLRRVPASLPHPIHIGDDSVDWVTQHRDIVEGAARLGVHPSLLLHPGHIAPLHIGALKVRPTHVYPFGASHGRVLRGYETVGIHVAVLISALLVAHLLLVLDLVCQPAHGGASRLVEVRVHNRPTPTCLGLFVWWKLFLNRTRELAASPDGLTAQSLDLLLLLL